jgi:hypothetical protein
MYHYIKKKKSRARTTPSLTHTHEMIQATSTAIEKTNLSRPRLVLPTGELCQQEGNPLDSSQLLSFFSSSTWDKAATKLGAIPSNIHRLQCFHKVQAPKMISELRPIGTDPKNSTSILRHQSINDLSSNSGARSWS